VIVIQTCAVVPTLDEMAVAPGTVARLAALDCLDGVLVVDDSPNGRTATAVEEAVDHDHVGTIVREHGDDLSGAVVEGLRATSADHVVVMDGDGQHPVSQVPELLAELERGADVVVGSRHCTGGEVVLDWQAHRQAISRSARYLSQLAVPLARRLSDPMSGMFAVDTALVEPDALRPIGYKILLEILARCPISDVREVPIEFGARAAGSSNLGLREQWQFIRHLGRLSIPARQPNVQVTEVVPTDD
jgi:Glycosyltransferases involved in cell wall biogenesis